VENASDDGVGVECLATGDRDVFEFRTSENTTLTGDESGDSGLENGLRRWLGLG
jgi:hypothetical protein